MTMRHECCSRRRATGPQPVPAFLYTGVALLTGDEVETGQMRRGAIAQLVERLHGMQEVWGSNPHSSTSQVIGTNSNIGSNWRQVVPPIFSIACSELSIDVTAGQGHGRGLAPGPRRALALKARVLRPARLFVQVRRDYREAPNYDT